MFISKHRCL